jgi:hypothetical protein
MQVWNGARFALPHARTGVSFLDGYGANTPRISRLLVLGWTPVCIGMERKWAASPRMFSTPPQAVLPKA